MDRRKETDITVIPIDEAELCKQAMEHMRIGVDSGEYKRKEMPGSCWSNKWAIAQTPKGTYAICTEGVGPKTTVEEKPLVIEFWFQSKKKKDEKGFDMWTQGMFPEISSEYSVQELEELATGKPVYLHDWIRSFGGRLEHNYWLWINILEKAYAK